MQRIQDATAKFTLDAPPTFAGPSGYFTEGVTGIAAATDVRGWWLNMMQEENMSVLAAGGVTPDTTGTVFNQLLQAINALIGSLFSTVHNVIGSRAIGTTYTNSNGKPMFVSAAGITVGAGTNLIFTGGGASFEFGQTATGSLLAVCGIVPAGGTYAITESIGTVTPSSWTETW